MRRWVPSRGGGTGLGQSSTRRPLSISFFFAPARAQHPRARITHHHKMPAPTRLPAAAAALGMLAAFSSSGAAQIPTPVLLHPTPDTLILQNGYVSATFNLTRGSLDVLQGRFVGDGDFSASPNLAGYTSSPSGRRGALAVMSWGLGSDASTASFDRPAPLPFAVTSNTSELAGFCVTLADAPAASAPRLNATLCLSIANSNPRGLTIGLPTLVATSAFAPTLTALSLAFAPPDAVIWYASRGVRQGFAQSQGYISSPAGNLAGRFYGIGDGATGAVEVLSLAGGGVPIPDVQSYIFAGSAAGGTTNSGLGLALFGAASPTDEWTSGFDGGATVQVAAGKQGPPVALVVYPNDYSFPPSDVPPTLPAKVVVDDLRSILTAVHGSPVSALHSYDFAPEVRAAPCLVHSGNQCYAPDFNFYDPDSGVSNSAMLYSFDPAVLDQVRGQLETNLAHVCQPSDPPSRCVPGQAIHHFVGNCNGGGPECVCTTMPSGVQDCVVYDAISGAVQTGPNVFTVLAALRYAGATGNSTWLAAHMPLLRSMLGFLESAFVPNVGLYNVPGSLQIDVFIRTNFTADSNAMIIILAELFAEAEGSLGNSTGAAFWQARAATLRTSLNTYLLAPSGDHYCTQSNLRADGGVDVCARDFVDYDANAIAVAAGVPTSAKAANAILARLDGGKCTHAGRATYVSEVTYNASNCVNGNTGDSAVSMGRIAWQDALARKAVGDAAAVVAFNTLILGPLQADLLRRTWLPERFDCSGNDAHNAYYFEYPAVVALLLYEVKYGLSLQMQHVLVDPLSADDFDFAMGSGDGAIHIGYYAGAAFHATLPAAFSGTRTFSVTGAAQGAWTVTPTGPSAPAAFPATVGADGVLTFTVPVGGGLGVDAAKN
jgi:hypothetical protein